MYLEIFGKFAACFATSAAEIIPTAKNSVISRKDACSFFSITQGKNKSMIKNAK